MAHYLFLHGACHSGWCFDPVVQLLESDGHQATSPDLPCDDPDAGLSEYTDTAVAALSPGAEDLIVVAHSLGALVAPMVAARVSIRRLVMVAGIIGAPRRSLEQLADTDADRDGPMGDSALEFNDQGLFRFTVQGAQELLYHDCEPAAAAAATARLRFQRSMWTQVAAFDAWPDTEIVSITCTQDRLVNPAWSDRIARSRLGVEPVHIASGHSPFLSRPHELAEILTAGV